MCARTHQTTKSLTTLLHYVKVDESPGINWSFPEFPHFHGQVAVVDSRAATSPRSRKHIVSATQLPWGLTIGEMFIGNARAETALAKPTWNDAARNHRAIMPVDCFYEKGVYFSSPKKPILALACLVVRSDDGPSVVVLTRPAIHSVANINHRMPLVIPLAKAAAWLNLDNDFETFKPLISSEFSLVGTTKPRVLLDAAA